MKPLRALLLAILAAAALLAAAGRAAPTLALSGGRPPMDMQPPTRLETATFALG